MNYDSDKQALLNKLRSNYEASRQRLLEHPLELRSENYEVIAAGRQVFNALLEYPFTADDVNYLLQFNHPLDVVTDAAWLEAHGIFDDELYEPMASAFNLIREGRTERPGDAAAVREKLRKNMDILSAEWQALSPEALIDRAEQIYVPYMIFETLQSYEADADEAGALLESESPLDVLSGEWRRLNSGVFAEAVKTVMAEVVGNPKNYDDYELDEVYAGRAEVAVFGATTETAAPKQGEQEEEKMSDLSKPFKIGDGVRTFKTALIEGEGKITGIADDDYDPPDCEDYFIVDFGERGTCTVHKDDIELL